MRALFFSADHKAVARLYFFTSLLFLAVGGLIAMLMRWQLAWPGAPVPLLGNWVGRMREQGGIMPPELYAELFTTHGTVMIFFVVIPMLVGAFGNFLVPLHVGAGGMAYERANLAAYYLHMAGGLVLLAGMFVPGGAAATGWTAYPPLSSIANEGQNWWIGSILLFGAGQVITAICQVTTIITARAAGMTWWRLPLAAWSFFATALLTIFSTPVLAAALVMLLLERAGLARFFSPSEGQPLLWQHLFWYYAHPAVYIMILPAFGMISEIVSVFARKPVFGYTAMVITTVAISLLGFLVWGHHMFQSGMNPYLGTSFMVATLVIAMPSAVKTFNWLATLWKGSIWLATPMLHAAAFISMFVIGGLSGVVIACTPVNVYLHDTFFIVGHLHDVLFGGSLFGIFAGLTYWFPKMFGWVLSEPLGKVHAALTFVFYNLTFFPMFILGSGGMMRRMYDTTQYDFLRPLQPWNVLITWSAFGLGLSQLLLLANMMWGARRHKTTEALNPWRANTLEWQISSPPPRTNYPETLTVYHPPYEYSRPGAAEDFLPQNQPFTSAEEATA